MKVINILGTPLAATTYEELAEYCWSRAGAVRPSFVDFSNTQIVTMRRHDPVFRQVTESFDLFAPDGMPLVWCLNCRGAQLADRVYGPTFMRRFLDHPPINSTHYLLGGSPDCGQSLRQRFLRAAFVGHFHGRCRSDGILDGEDEARVIDEINQASPDFIWVGLGTPKQYAWIHRHRGAIQRGVILAVGFAFDVNAGTKPDAPAWMQRRGLTWVFRIWSEPRRLAIRYLRYNSLFLIYLVKDMLGRRSG